MSFLNPSKTDVRRRRLLVGGASVVLTTIVMTGFLLESRSGYSPPDLKLVYMENWTADRSRDQTLADLKATTQAQEARLAESRAYIATLFGEARTKAQEQYDAYVAGGGAQKDIPYVPAATRGIADPIVRPATGANTGARPPAGTEPPVR
jgi:hypothetical protein